LVTLLLGQIDLNLYAFVGILMLVGMVKKNAIMMIDVALDAQRTDGTPALEAIDAGCLIRFRPIMMTTMAALMGTLPIALGFGAGAESRRPLGLAVGGLAGVPGHHPLLNPGVLSLHGSVPRQAGQR
jgi:hydrophobic/amphiphilic exporter-1 (mainly G- bacteria), HAE1 family